MTRGEVNGAERAIASGEQFDASRLYAANVVGYLGSRGLLPQGLPARVTALSGGISNTVLQVHWPGGAVVVKQALPQLRVRERWDFDPRRSLVEAECMRALERLLGPGATPHVLDVDRDRLAFTMSCAPSDGRVWKDALLAGDVDPSVADMAGEMLGRVHRGSAGDPSLASAFDDLMPLMQGRIKPYHRTAQAANPDLREIIEQDIARLTTGRRTLVLGDYSPKNLIVVPEQLLALDFEVAHWGDPAFDTSFLLTHLIAKALHLPPHTDSLLDSARRFWHTYTRTAGTAGATEADTATELGILMLCRVDGKSRLEYQSPQERARFGRLARELVGDRIDRLEAILERARAAAARGVRR